MSTETIATEVLAASLGGAISASILYPLEVLKTKMQAVDHSTSASDEDEDDDDNDDNKEEEQLSMIPFMKQLYLKQGAGVFFRGVETSAFQSALEKALYFFAYTTLKNGHASATGGARLDTVTNLLLGCAAEWAHLPISLPVDAWTTKIQTQDTTSTQTHQAPMQILMTMMRDKDCKFYKGLSAYYLLCFKPALQYTVFEQVKAAWLQSKNAKTGGSHSGGNSHQQSSLSAAEAFLLGMVARTIATVAVFPFLRAKVVMQTRKTTTTTEADGTPDTNGSSSNNESNGNGSPDSSNNHKNKDSLLTLLLETWQTKGLAGLYQGLGPELTRGIFSAALMLMIKEKIAVSVRSAVEGRRANMQRQMASR
jgi:adenine nucleotide transporter 17